MQKGFAHLLLPIVVLIVLVAGSVYFYNKDTNSKPQEVVQMNEQESEEQEETPTPEPTKTATPVVKEQQNTKDGLSSETNNDSSNSNNSSNSNANPTPQNTTAPAPTNNPIPTSIPTNTPIPTSTPQPSSGTVSLSTNSVSVTLSKSQATGGFVYGNGYDLVNDTTQTISFCVYNTTGAQGVGFQQASGAIPGKLSMINKTYINANKANGTYTGTVTVKYGTSSCSSTTLGDVSYSITLTD